MNEGPERGTTSVSIQPFVSSPSPLINGRSCASVCKVAKQKLKQNHIRSSLLFMVLITSFRNCFISHEMILVEPEYISLSVLRP